MFKPKPRKPVLFGHTFKQIYRLKGVAVVALISLGLSLTFVLGTHPPTVSATPNNTLNFQARLETASGAIAPDGDYNIEFKLYDTTSSSGSSQGSCTGDTDCLWTETRIGADKVHVANGYLTVDLGSVTSLPGTINWDQNLYLTMNIGGTGSPSWDGEMSPRLHLTAVPYALQAKSAEQLQTLLSGHTGTLQFNSLGADETINLPDITGGGTFGLMALQSASPGTQQTGNFNVSGTGIAGTAIQTPLLDTPSGTTTLAIGTTNATLINLNQNTAVTGTKTFTVNGGLTTLSAGLTETGTAQINASGSSATTIGNSGAGAVQLASGSASSFNVTGSTLALSGTNFSLNTSGVLSLQGGQTQDITTPSAAAATALTVQSGNTTVDNGTGGQVTVKGGNETNATCSTNCIGGALTLQGGDANGGAGTNHGGNVSIDAGAGSGAGGVNGTVNIATVNSAGVNIGKTTGSATINLGQSNGAYTLNLASTVPSGTNTQTVNIASPSTNQSTASTINLNILSSSGNGTNGTAVLKLGNSDRVTQIDVGNVAADAARTINVGTGDNIVGIDTLNIGTGATQVAGGKTIHIGDGTPSGSGTNVITIGSIAALANTTLIQGGNGATAIELQSASGGTIGVGDNGVANTVNIGQTGTTGVTQTINVGNAGSGATTNVTVGNVNAGTTTIQGAGGISLANSTTVTSGHNLTLAGGVLTSQSGADNQVAIVAKGHSATQTGDLFDAQNSNGTTLYGISSAGNQETLGYYNNVYGGIGPFGNLLIDSEQFDQTATWVNSANLTSPSANTQVAPDGNTTAEQLVTTAASQTDAQTCTTGCTTNSATYTFSVWLKTNSGTQPVQLRIDWNNGAGQTGTPTASLTVGTTWHRFSVTQQVSASGMVSVTPTILITNNAATVDAWGAQMVVSSLPQVYVRTTGAQVAASTGVVSNGGEFISSISTADVPLVIQAAPTQSSTLFQLQSSAGANLASIDAGSKELIGTLDALTSGGTLAIGSTNTSASGGAVTIASGATAGTVTIGGASETGTITLGQSTQTDEIDIGHAQVAIGKTQTIKIGDSATGTGFDAITIGNTNGASSLSLNAGTGGITATSTNFNVSSGTTTLGSSSVAGSLVLQDGSGHTVTFQSGGAQANSPVLSLPSSVAATDTFCLQTKANCSAGASSKSVTEIVAMSSTSTCSTPNSVASSDTAGADYVATGCTAESAINSAISALPANGGVVYLEDGTYIISSAITLPSNVTLEGAGGNTILELKNGLNTAVNMLYTSTYVSKTMIKDMTLDGNSSQQSSGAMYGMYLESNSTTGATIDQVAVQNFRTDGIYATYGNFTIENTSSTGNGNDGFNVGGSNSSITDSIAASNTSRGFYDNGSRNSYSGDQAESNGNCGFYITGTDDTVVNSQAYNNTGAGIETIGYVAVTGSSSYGNTTDGIYMDGNGTASGNIVYGNTNDGINVQYSTNATINGNQIYNNAYYGIQLFGGSYNTITGNAITLKTSTVYDGIYLSNSDHNTITSNTIAGASSATGYAINVTGSSTSDTYLSGNTYAGTGASTIHDGDTTTIYGSQVTNTGGSLLQQATGITQTVGTGNYVLNGVAASTYAIGAATVGGSITLGGASQTGATTLQGQNITAVLTGASSNPSLVIKTGSNSTGAFQVQNSSGYTVLTVDTSSNSNQGQVILGNSSHNNGVLLFNNSAGAAQVGLAVTSSNVNSYTLTLPVTAPSTSQCLQSDSSVATKLVFGSCGSGSGVTTVGGIDTQTKSSNGAVISGSSIYMQTADFTNPGLVSTGSQTITGDKLFKSTSNSQTALQVQNSSAASLLRADTTNMRLAVNSTFAAMSAPTQNNTSTCASSCIPAGTLTAATYFYKITAIDAAGGETTASNEKSQVTTGSTSTVTLSWNAITGAAGYKIYRSTSTGTEKYLTSSTLTTYIDTGAIATQSTLSPPGSNTAYASTNVSNSSLQLALGGNGSPTGQLYVSGTVPSAALATWQAAGISTSGATDVTVQGNYLYEVNAGEDTMKIFDISNPAAPVLESTYGTDGSNPVWIRVQGNYAYITEQNDGFEIVDVRDASTPIERSYTAIGDSNANGLYISGRYLYILGWTSNSELQIWDISDPFVPEEISHTVTTTADPMDVYVQGRYAYVAEWGGNSMEIFNVSDPSAPTSVWDGATGSGSTAPDSVWVQGNYAYVTNSSTNTLQVFNVSNPNSPTTPNSAGWATGTGPGSVRVQGRYLYELNGGSNTLQIFDISNPGAPVSIGTVATATAPNDVWISGRYAYVVSGGTSGTTNEFLQVYDLGGGYIQQLETGGLSTGTLQTAGNVTVNGDESIQGGLSVGGTLDVAGNADVRGWLVIGSGTNQESQPQLLVLDNSDDNADPGTVTNGAMYYNAPMNSFRCGIDGHWHDCTGLMYSTTSDSSQVGGTSEAAFGQTWTAPQDDCQPGVVYHITAAGLATSGTANYSLTFNLQDGSTDIASAVVKNGTSSHFNIDLNLTCRASFGFKVEGDAFDQYTGGSNVGGNFIPFTSGSGTLANGSGGDALGFSAQWSTGPGSGKGATLDQFIVQRMGP